MTEQPGHVDDATDRAEPVEAATSGQPEQAEGRQSMTSDDQAVDDVGDNGGIAVEDTVENTQEGASGSGSRRLEEEGDVAADYVEELLDIADLDGDIDIEVRQGRTYVSVVAEEGDDRLRDLSGPDGKGLNALQELTRLAVLASTGNRSRLVLDIAGRRAEQAGRLEQLAREAIQRVKDGESEVHLEPMGAYERKIVHDVVAEAGLVSESEGEGSRRHVVVSTGD